MDQQQLAHQLLAQAKEQGVELICLNGLLNRLTKNVLETALEAEMAEHLVTEIGLVDIDVPRDVNSSFDPHIVKKCQRRLTGIDEIVLSLTAKGLTIGEVAAHC